MINIIGLCGPMGVGKSTYARKIAEEQDGVIYSFADTLKEMLAVLVGRHPVYENKSHPIEWLGGVTGRSLLQSLGTEWGRNMVGSDLWVRALEQKFQSSYAPLRLIDDLRFENEAHMVRRLGGEVWLVKRDGVEYTNEHSSETPLPDHLIDKEVEL